jgi:very-short-patch-repair endonuclease
MAAVLACGSGAVLSHRSAAALWSLLPGGPASVDVTAPARRGRAPYGINAHRHHSLRARDVTTAGGIPCTTVARTLLDLAGVVPTRELRQAVEEAEVLRLLELPALEEVLKRSRGRRGVARLRLQISELDPQAKRTRSSLERRFLALCRRAGLPAPEVNVLLHVRGHPVEADFMWRDARLIVEADGRQFHDTASAFERDRLRDQRLSLEGWQVIRCTWRQVVNEPAGLSEVIRALLRR